MLNGKRVLVTGADGFIGSHLVEMLVAHGALVRALSYYNSFNNWGWLEDTNCLDDIEVVSGDVRDPHMAMKLVSNVDVVFHLAALIGIPYSYLAPASYTQTNIDGTLNMVKAAMDSGVDRFVHTSTSEVYGSAQYVPIDEKHPLQPQSPYSASKISADAMAMSFFHAFELPVIVARPFNTYGPRQSARAVIPTVISQILAGESVLRLGALSPTRDFNFVEDTCKGFLALAECDGAIGKTVNIGSGCEISIGGLVDMIVEIMGSDICAEMDGERVRPQGSEVQRLCCDNTLFRKLTSTVPEVSLRDGLERTVDWFRDSDNRKNYKVGIYNV